jgi:hypothetical protein
VVDEIGGGVGRCGIDCAGREAEIGRLGRRTKRKNQRKKVFEVVVVGSEPCVMVVVVFCERISSSSSWVGEEEEN